jgi:hypothetical protein
VPFISSLVLQYRLFVIRDLGLGSKKYDLPEEQVDQDQESDLKEKDKNRSKAAYYVEKINDVIPGFGSFVNYLLSPNVLILLAAIGAGCSFFSPLGIAFGIPSVILLSSITIAMIVGGVVMTKNMDIQKQTTSVIKEIEKDGLEIKSKLEDLQKMNGTMNLNIDVNKIVSNSMYGSLSQMASVLEKPEVEKPTFFESIRGGVAGRFPINAFMLGTGIATLNPLIIGLTVTSVILGEASQIREEAALAEVYAKFNNDRAQKNYNLGLPNLEGEEGLKTYRDFLCQLKREKFALERFKKRL